MTPFQFKTDWFDADRVVYVGTGAKVGQPKLLVYLADLTGGPAVIPFETHEASLEAKAEFGGAWSTAAVTARIAARP